jgi:type IV secretory pathway VirB6-like protein
MKKGDISHLNDRPLQLLECNYEYFIITNNNTISILIKNINMHNKIFILVIIIIIMIIIIILIIIIIIAIIYIIMVIVKIINKNSNAININNIIIT